MITLTDGNTYAELKYCAPNLGFTYETGFTPLEVVPFLDHLKNDY